MPLSSTQSHPGLRDRHYDIAGLHGEMNESICRNASASIKMRVDHQRGRPPTGGIGLYITESAQSLGSRGLMLPQSPSSRGNSWMLDESR